ncbi:helix-turn-helix domain-containing protein [Leucobacter sp. M11]|uniref:helix-turn-helix domain-containing protein n=1 Tax=Leucobacter sp. M11 TaxID=2993565 RepID=UPI002D7FA1ED|nr:helix-turn-helix domain-containing protein [Leucobacter sp. M11]MEB4615989.1 helix-turn-helix domain-containing protein [Leucobacter sp. M11]
MITDYEAGISAYELAEKYGHNRGTIMKHLAGAGIRSRVAVPTDDEILQLRELRAEGLGYKTIARRVGRNHKTIRKHLTV